MDANKNVLDIYWREKKTTRDRKVKLDDAATIIPKAK